MSYLLEWEPRGVVIRFQGVINIKDIVSATNAFQGDECFDYLHYVIADYSGITDCDTKPEDIDDVWVADYGAKRINQNIRKAIVTTNPKVKALRDRYQHVLGEAYPTNVFTSEKDARAWLNT